MPLMTEQWLSSPANFPSYYIARVERGNLFNQSPYGMHNTEALLRFFHIARSEVVHMLVTLVQKIVME